VPLLAELGRPAQFALGGPRAPELRQRCRHTRWRAESRARSFRRRRCPPGRHAGQRAPTPRAQRDARRKARRLRGRRRRRPAQPPWCCSAAARRVMMTIGSDRTGEASAGPAQAPKAHVDGDCRARTGEGGQQDNHAEDLDPWATASQGLRRSQRAARLGLIDETMVASACAGGGAPGLRSPLGNGTRVAPLLIQSGTNT